ncbi:DgyrCDS11101 [Dimorphilus gyrociliatus]|uniref:DgyrCDS11101 n=1 Tax=Dimorphilus gyrociliatus TaxID=2664684 RepID=A0A7I8W3N2_9ANNE|nr:DgyrCDS11101 [Dimorphilus gyrociliatus]
MDCDQEVAVVIDASKIKVSEGISLLSEIWKDIGISGSIRTERLKAVKNHIVNIVDEMTREESELRDKLLKNVEKLTNEVQDLNKELDLEIVTPSEELTILQLEKELRRKRDDLGKIKQQRMKVAEELKEEDQKYCNMLVTTPYYLPSNSIPTLNQLEELEQHIKKSKIDYDQRLATFQDYRSNIKKLLDILEITANDSFQSEIINEDVSEFCLSRENLQRVHRLELDLENQKQSNIKQAKNLREKLESLWNRLQIGEEERGRFCSFHTGFKPSTLVALRKEIDKYEILKKENVSKVIEATRSELEKWWEKCFYSQQQKSSFEEFFSIDFTEEVLERHEKELEKVKTFYQENEFIFQQIHQYQAMWWEYLEYERRAQDPNRYNNRGGKILKEEKHRKKLEKELPKLENKLLSDVSEWELKIGKNILVEGVRFVDFVHIQKENYELQKQKEKDIRKQQKEKEMEKEMRYGSKPTVAPGKRRFMGTTTLATKSPKIRKVCPHLKAYMAMLQALFICMLPFASVLFRYVLFYTLQKDGGVLSSESEGSTAVSIKMKHENETYRTPGRTPGRSQAALTPLSTIKVKPRLGINYPNSPMIRKTPLKNTTAVRKVLSEKNSEISKRNNEASIASVPNYAEFEEELAEKPNCRSSVMPGHDRKVAYL